MKRAVFASVLFLSLAANALAVDFVCKTQSSADIDAIAASINATVIDSIPESRTYLLSAPNLPAFTPAGVEYIELNVSLWAPKQKLAIVSKTVTSSTAIWYQQQPAMQRVNLQAALGLSTGRRIVIADINSAVDYGHPALIGHLTGGHDFVRGNRSSSASLNQATTSFLDQATTSFLDQATTSFLDQATTSFLDQATTSFLDAVNPAHGHGTLVAGILAAMAPEAMIMPLRVFNNDGEADAVSIAKAIRYATKNGADIINMSFGLSESSKTVAAALDEAARKGVILVASAGNEGWDNLQYPAAYPNVIAVTATTNQDTKASFANYGSTIDNAAPGANVISAYPDGYYAVVSGTSFAAPMVAAEAALVLSLKNALGTSISSGVVNIDALNPDYAGQLGAGRVDLYKALTIN